VTSFLVPTLLTNTVLPLFNEYRLNNVGPIFTIFLIAFVAHAIIEYRFLEIRLVIKRSFDFIFLWGFSFLLIIAFYLFLGRLVTVTVVHGIAAFAIAICFGPVARFIDALTVRLTSRGTYIFDQAVARISEVAHASIDLHELQSAVVDRVAEYFGYANIAFVTFPPHTPTQPLKAVVRGYAKDVVKGLVSAHGFCVDVRFGDDLGKSWGRDSSRESAQFLSRRYRDHNRDADGRNGGEHGDGGGLSFCHRAPRIRGGR
jgi:hypothetical protein